MKKKVSKKVVKKDNPQKIINQLKEDVNREIGRKEGAQGNVEKLEQTLDSIANIVKYRGHSTMFADETTRIWDKENLSELIGEVSSMRSSLKKLEEREELGTYMLKGENNKLWYLVRAIAGDNTLKGVEESNHCSHPGITKEGIRPIRTSPFDNPNF